jgi:hypothetical protein
MVFFLDFRSSGDCAIGNQRKLWQQSTLQLHAKQSILMLLADDGFG